MSNTERIKNPQEIVLEKSDDIAFVVAHADAYRIKIQHHVENNGWDTETSYWKNEQDDRWEKCSYDVQNHTYVAMEDKTLHEKHMIAELTAIQSQARISIYFYTNSAASHPDDYRDLMHDTQRFGFAQ